MNLLEDLKPSSRKFQYPLAIYDKKFGYLGYFIEIG